MNTSKLIEKLENFFSLSNKKQSEKLEKLQVIIEKLERKKTKLEIETQIEKENDRSSERFHELDNQLNVINSLIEKARLHISQLQPDDGSPNDLESDEPSA